MRITADAKRLFGRAVSLKLASDREWERALTFAAGRGDAQRRAQDRWLDSAGDDLAIEIGFETSVFVGLRADERCNADQLVTALLFRVTHPTSSSAEPGPQTGGRSQVLAAIDQTAPPRFSGVPATRAELGVLDRWASLGAVDLGPPPWQNLADSFPSKRPSRPSRDEIQLCLPPAQTRRGRVRRVRARGRQSAATLGTLGGAVRLKWAA